MGRFLIGLTFQVAENDGQPILVGQPVDFLVQHQAEFAFVLGSDTAALQPVIGHLLEHMAQWGLVDEGESIRVGSAPVVADDWPRLWSNSAAASRRSSSGAMSG